MSRKSERDLTGEEVKAAMKRDSERIRKLWAAAKEKYERKPVKD